MKVLNSVILLALMLALWGVSDLISSRRLNNLVSSGKIPYGPLPDADRNYYSYSGLNSAFDSSLDLKRSEEFTRGEFQELILSSLSASSQKNLKRYLATTLRFSEDYQIDPFWIISIMMVESGFDKTAQSPKNARGLMQIKPDTAEHLYQLMNKKVSGEQVQRNLHYPKENIEVGVFYLKKLLQNFRMNYQFATIAYNLGPNKLKSRLNAGDINTANYSYLLKVSTCYNKLSKNFADILKMQPKPFESTYVVKGQGTKLEEHILGLFITANPVLEADLHLVQRI